jgi:hypothetical protein
VWTVLASTMRSAVTLLMGPPFGLTRFPGNSAAFLALRQGTPALDLRA